MTTTCAKVRQHIERLEKLKAKYTWDEKEATRAVSFIEGNLRHWKEPFAGKPFILSEWQRELIIKPLWGLRREDGTRVFRRAYIQIPRKNGKSALAAAILMLVLCLDGEGLELYTAATKRDQAMIVFNDCCKYVKASPKLKARLKVFVGKITYPAKSSFLKPLSADYDSLDGLNTSCAVVDELHAHKSPDLWDVIVTSTGARSQPLVVAITTAGKLSEGVCHAQFEHSRDILDGTVEDDEYFCFITEIDKGVDWRTPEAYRMANPNFGVSAREEYLEAARQRALTMPSERRMYRRYHLNEWQEEGTDQWLPMEAWRKCEAKVPEMLKGRRCYGGLDLASTTDLASLSLAFPMDDGIVWFLDWIWCPEEGAEERSRTDHVPYNQWAEDGFLIKTPGNVVDYHAIVNKVLELREGYDQRDVAYDDWNGVAAYTDLDRAGVKMVKFIQGLRSFHPPCQEFEKLVLEGKVRHAGNRCADWCLGNTHVLRDNSDKMRPIKDPKKKHLRIDATVSKLMALDALMRGEREAPAWTLHDIPEDFRRVVGA